MADFSSSIRSWFRQSKRNLPWRSTNDPYKIWLSEIILQQTRVDQGTAYYLKFVANYPTVEHLANANQDEVLNLWQGLGYYSRARNMHYSAKQVVNSFSGKFPTTYKTILSLKGVGEYAAAAIASIAYNLPHAVVDGNVYRVLSRYLAISTPIDSTEGKKVFKAAAHELLDENNPGDHNQALMEIGALVCAPKNPKCDECPLQNGCLAFAAKTQLEYPVKTKKTKVRTRYFNYLVISDGKSIVLKKRQGEGIWEGLYDFPLIEKSTQKELTDELKERAYESVQKDGQFKHILSHQIIQATFWFLTVDQIDPQSNEIVVNRQSIGSYPMPQLLIRYLQASAHFEAE